MSQAGAQVSASSRAQQVKGASFHIHLRGYFKHGKWNQEKVGEGQTQYPVIAAG